MEIRTLYVSIQSNRIQGDNTNKASFTKMHIPMIRKSILLGGLLCAAGFLSAQPFSFGIRGGYTLANFDIKGSNGAGIFFNSNNKQSLGGMHIGLEGRWELDQRWAVLAGLQYNQKGYRSEIFWPSGPAPARNIFHYLNIPALGDLRIWRGLSIQAGIEAGWLIDSRIKSAGENASNKDLKIYRDFDLGFIAGVEYRINESFFVGVRNSWGVLNLYGSTDFTDDQGNPLDISGHNRAFQFSAGYRYAFNK